MRLKDTVTLHMQPQIITKKRHGSQSGFCHPKEASLSLNPRALLVLNIFDATSGLPQLKCITLEWIQRKQTQQNPSPGPLDLRPGSWQGKCSRLVDRARRNSVPDLPGRARVRQLQEIDGLRNIAKSQRPIAVSNAMTTHQKKAK